ncbi:MAG TPA: hypothetical protein DDY70_06250 [Clostridiales bacterium]|nr:hypothetical protein [Clostridiales bacterium]
MLSRILPLLPRDMREEILHIAASSYTFADRLAEIRLRADSVSSLVVGGKNLPLHTTVTEEETEAILGKICHGSLYAYRDRIAEGYVPMAGGIRVGVVGQARYEAGRSLGISGVRTLVFRIPHKIPDSADTLCKAFLGHCRSGMLIYSPPGVGKTTALRALAARLGSGKDARRVVVIDEREEFDPEDYRHATVDILRGYHRARGIEIATRTLAPEVLLIDEVGGEEEARAMLGVLRAGVPFVATAHAATERELYGKGNLSPFFAARAFDLFAELWREGDRVLSRIFGEERELCAISE